LGSCSKEIRRKITEVCEGELWNFPLEAPSSYPSPPSKAKEIPEEETSEEAKGREYA